MASGEPSPRVRAATINDIEEVFELARLMAITFEPDRGAFQATYETVLDASDAHLLVVDVSGRVGGYLLGFEHPAFFANGQVAWVEEIAVRTELRRHRLGALLMATYEDGVRSRGGRLVALATTRAGAFYEALGYDNHAAYYRKLFV
jgi:GNAT superfamily N-acetyltransferase